VVEEGFRRRKASSLRVQEPVDSETKQIPEVLSIRPRSPAG
jgi:hypothetical protein